MNRLKTIPFLLLFLFLTGCTHAWVVSSRDGGGTIGYRGYTDRDKAAASVKELIPCANFTVIEDVEKGSIENSFIPITTTQYNSGTVFGSRGGSANYYGQSQQTNFVQTTYDNTWRELSYHCNDIPGVSSKRSEKSKETPIGNSPEACEKYCANRPPDVAPGTSTAECIRRMCR